MTPTLPHAVESRLTDQWPAHSWCDSHLVLAVSAGRDSVAMLRAVLAVKQRCGGAGQVVVAHLHHGLRGAGADADQAWLETLCRRLHTPLEIGRADTPALAAAQGDGLEAAARDARYEFLLRTAEQRGARFVAVAHTADDQVETILHHILRGTGLAGLAGMPASRPLSPSVALVRPLLALGRSEVLAYLGAIGQDYREDPTNTDTRWTRNRLRHELLPVLRRQYNADVDQALLRLAAQASESQSLIAALAETLAADCILLPGPAKLDRGTVTAAARIDCAPLEAKPQLLIREVCRTLWQKANWPMQEMGFGSWQLLAELVQGTRTASINLPGNLRASREINKLVIEHRGGSGSAEDTKC